MRTLLKTLFGLLFLTPVFAQPTQTFTYTSNVLVGTTFSLGGGGYRIYPDESPGYTLKVTAYALGPNQTNVLVQVASWSVTGSSIPSWFSSTAYLHPPTLPDTAPPFQSLNPPPVFAVNTGQGYFIASTNDQAQITSASFSLSATWTVDGEDYQDVTLTSVDGASIIKFNQNAIDALIYRDASYSSDSATGGKWLNGKQNGQIWAYHSGVLAGTKGSTPVSNYRYSLYLEFDQPLAPWFSGAITPKYWVVDPGTGDAYSSSVGGTGTFTVETDRGGAIDYASFALLGSSSAVGPGSETAIYSQYFGAGNSNGGDILISGPTSPQGRTPTMLLNGSAGTWGLVTAIPK